MISATRRTDFAQDDKEGNLLCDAAKSAEQSRHDSFYVDKVRELCG